MAGYSARPPAASRRPRPGVGAAVLNAPWDYAATLGLDCVPQVIAPDAAIPPGLGYIHLFTTSRSELERRLAEARAGMAEDGMIWVSWPKKSSNLASEITEDTIRAVCLPIGLVDVKVCAVDAVWSGLKLAIRKKLRAG